MSASPDPAQGERAVWEVRRERVDECGRALLEVLKATPGEWVPIWPTLCNAQLRDERGLVDVALSEAIDAARRHLGVTVERWEASEDGGLRIYYRVPSDG